jgi:hypothetical protein
MPEENKTILTNSLIHSPSLENTVPVPVSPVFPSVPVPPQPINQNFEQNPITIPTPDPTNQKKPIIFKIFSVIFFLAGLSNIPGAFSMCYVVYILDKAQINAGSFPTLFRYYPIYALFPFIFIFSVLGFVYLALKVKEGSLSSFWVCLVGMIFIPIIQTIGIAVLMGAILLKMNSILPASEQYVPLIDISNVSNTQISYLNIILLLLLIVLIFSYKKFNYPTIGLSIKAKKFLLIFSLLLIVPIIIVISYSFYNNFKSDDSFPNAESIVGYKLCKPTIIPDGRIQTITFKSGQDMGGGLNNAVRVIYDYDLFETNHKPSLISLAQVKVGSDFNLRDFIINSEIKENFKSIPFPISKNGTAFYSEKSSGLLIKSIGFITSDNILIQLITLKASEQELINLANSLKCN